MAGRLVVAGLDGIEPPYPSSFESSHSIKLYTYSTAFILWLIKHVSVRLREDEMIEYGCNCVRLTLSVYRVCLCMRGDGGERVGWEVNFIGLWACTCQ